MIKFPFFRKFHTFAEFNKKCSKLFLVEKLDFWIWFQWILGASLEASNFSRFLEGLVD